MYIFHAISMTKLEIILIKPALSYESIFCLDKSHKRNREMWNIIKGRYLFPKDYMWHPV